MLDTSPQPKPAASPRNRANAAEPGPRFGLFWLCLAVGLLAITALVWLLGLTWWTALVAALLIGCPVVMAWILLGGLDR